MLRLQRLVVLALGIAAVPVLMAADTINLQLVQPNIGGAKNCVYGQGNYAVDPLNTFDKILFFAEDTVTKQQNSNTAFLPVNPPGTWNKTLQVVASTYDCWGRLYTKTVGGTVDVKDSNVIQATVQ